MEDKKLNNMLKRYFYKRIDVPERGAKCPSVETLDKYVSGALEPDELYNVGSHVKSCKFCNELIEEALLHSAYEKHISLDRVPAKVKEKAKSLNPAYKTRMNKIMDRLKRNSWLILSLSSLIASFFISRYFFQFLILAILFGFKWIFNRESTRVLIMIYNAWKKHDKDTDKELERIFKERL